MGITVTQCKENLSAMLHGGSLKRVRNFEALLERVSNTVLSNINPIETIRSIPLNNTVHDDIYNYSLPSDFKSIIDLIPQDNRNSLDSAVRNYASKFDLKKEFTRNNLSIEGNEGSKIIRINWKSRQGKVLNAMDSLTTNGTWSVVGSATGLVLDTITKRTGGGSIRFDIVVTGDGIKNNGMTAVDMEKEDEVADAFLSFYIKDSTDLNNLTSIQLLWGNNLSTDYWTGIAQTTQADGTDFKVGWNEIRIPWSTATETGTVDATKIDSVKIIVTATSAITDIRIDHIVFSIGRNFDIKYYSKFLLKNTSGVWITKTTSNDDTIILDNDAIQILLLELLIGAAQQVEGSDSRFDIDWAKSELYGVGRKSGLYQKYISEYPNQSKKAVISYGSNRFNNRFRI